MVVPSDMFDDSTSVWHPIPLVNTMIL